MESVYRALWQLKNKGRNTGENKHEKEPDIITNFRTSSRNSHSEIDLHIINYILNGQ